MATPRFQFADRQAEERALRLKGYAQSDRADALAAKLGQRDEEDAARNALMQQRLDLERAANDRKTATSEARRQIAEDNLKRMQDASDRENKIREAKQALADAAQKAKDDRSLTILNQGTGFLNDAVGMDYTKPEFDQQLQKLQAGYPQAGSHPLVQNWLKAHDDLRKQHVAFELQQQNEAAKQATAKAAVQLHYSKTNGLLSDLYAQRRDNPAFKLPNGESGQAAIEGAEELKRSMEEQYPSLRKDKTPSDVSRGTINSSETTKSTLPPGLSPIQTNLTAQPDPAAPISPVVATADAPVSTLTGADAPTVVNPNLSTDDSAIQPLSEVAPTTVGLGLAGEHGIFSPIVTTKDSSFLDPDVRKEMSQYEDVMKAHFTNLDGGTPDQKAAATAMRNEYMDTYGNTDPFGASMPRWLSEVKGVKPYDPTTVATAPTPAVATPQSPDLGALAQKALDDPDATEEHKAAAKRFLNRQSGQAAGAALVSAGT